MDISKANKVLIYGGINLITELLLDELEFNNIKSQISEHKKTDDVYNEIKIYHPSHIIYYREYDNKETNIIIEDNLIEPLLLLNYCNKYDIHLTYIGTGFIYKNNNNFLEKIDANNFDNSYFIAKSSMDRIIKVYYDVVLNIRIKLPVYFGDKPDKFLDNLLINSKICEIPNSITVLNDFIPQIISWIMEYRVGTINATNSGFILKNDILNLYEEYNVSTKNIANILINNIGKTKVCYTDIDGIDIKSKLDLSKLHSWWNNCPHINRSIKNLLNNYQKNNYKNVEI